MLRDFFRSENLYSFRSRHTEGGPRLARVVTFKTKSTTYYVTIEGLSAMSEYWINISNCNSVYKQTTKYEQELGKKLRPTENLFDLNLAEKTTDLLRGTKKLCSGTKKVNTEKLTEEIKRLIRDRREIDKASPDMQKSTEMLEKRSGKI